jgi:hypothetical protein
MIIAMKKKKGASTARSLQTCCATTAALAPALEPLRAWIFPAP